MKQLIYTDITKVLYMMKNHGIRFQKLIYNEIFKGFDGWTEIHKRLEYGFNLNQPIHFRVHPDDVAKFDPAENDVVNFGTEGLEISSRDGKTWLSPDEVRDGNS